MAWQQLYGRLVITQTGESGGGDGDGDGKVLQGLVKRELQSFCLFATTPDRVLKC